LRKDYSSVSGPWCACSVANIKICVLMYLGWINERQA
jgi:hypothetical protein